MTRTRFDVAIVGGGPAGLATAILLARAGWDVLVVELTDYASLRVGEHLAPSARPLLAWLGLADIVATGEHALSPGVRSAWGSAAPVDKDYLFDPHGEGVNLSRPQFDRSLAAHAIGCGADLRMQTKIAALSRSAGLWRLSLATAGGLAEVAAHFLVDATGRAASVAKRLGSQPLVYDDLIGVFGQGCDVCAMSKWVFIEAQPDGWWYSAGLVDGSSVATFLTDADLVDLSGAGRVALWRTQLEKSALTRTRYEAEAAAPPPLHVRSARTQRLERVTGEAWLAVGDAAMSFDPLSSEGISKGLHMGRAAADAAATFCQGNGKALLDYERGAEGAFAEYLDARRSFYAAEGRWPDAPFWQRRRERF